MAYICFIVPIWVNAPKASGKVVMTEFTNSGGWSSMGLAVLAGQLSGIYTQVGVDTAAHVSEEVRSTSHQIVPGCPSNSGLTSFVLDASKAVPRAMMSVYVINFCLIFPAIITLCFAMPNLEDALSDPSTYAAVYVLRQSMDTAWLTVVLTMITCLLICSNVSYLTAVTRDLFAFGRDNGFPFSSWISKVMRSHRLHHTLRR